MEPKENKLALPVAIVVSAILIAGAFVYETGARTVQQDNAAAVSHAALPTPVQNGGSGCGV